MWLRALLIVTILIGLLLTGCSREESSSSADEPSAPALTVNFESPVAIEIPPRMEPKSDADWEAIVNNKNAEIIEVLNILNPVAAYIIAAFEQYSGKLGEITHEEWTDTQEQLARAGEIYDDCKNRMDAGNIDKKLFLDLEEAWQVFVKVGVAGLRTKAMIESDLARAARG